jgi:hypothetical protein
MLHGIKGAYSILDTGVVKRPKVWRVRFGIDLQEAAPPMRNLT